MSKETVSRSTASQPQTLTLEEIAAHFEHWRREKKKGERIPDQLWSEAIALVKDYGLSQVTRRLRLSGRDLNRRRGINGLAAQCRQRLREDPFTGAIFVFRNRRATALKLLCYDGQGFWLCQRVAWMKRRGIQVRPTGAQRSQHRRTTPVPRPNWRLPSHVERTDGSTSTADPPHDR
ncbi:MAG: IS66 family insertion sequence element accessory protein TnpB [Thiohalocapsa sp.]